MISLQRGLCACSTLAQVGAGPGRDWLWNPLSDPNSLSSTLFCSQEILMLLWDPLGLLSSSHVNPNLISHLLSVPYPHCAA